MSVNRVTLLGNIGQDPRIHTTENEKKVATFSIATTERGYTRQDGTQVPERTDWHNVVVWGPMAGIVEIYIKKGSRLYLEGQLRTRFYEKNGVRHYLTEVYASQLELIGNNNSTRPLPADTSSTNGYVNQPMDVNNISGDLPF